MVKGNRDLLTLPTMNHANRGASCKAREVQAMSKRATAMGVCGMTRFLLLLPLI